MDCIPESGPNQISPDLTYYTPLQALKPSTTIIAGRSAYTMSPIFTLPVELLSRVFTLGMPEGEYPDFPPSDEVPFEQLVSHVCQHWRNVALRTHQLWTIIHFRLNSHIERASIYLKRSQHHLIDILIDTCAAEEHVPGVTLFRDEFRLIFNTILEDIARWRSLTLKVRDRECKIGARSVLSSCGRAPYLEYLQLWHIENWESPERLFTQIGPPPVVVFDGSLPRLKHIVLIGVNVPWNKSPFLEDLSTVEFALHSEDVRIPYDIWANMLATSPNLTKLSLHYSGPRSAVEGWPTDVINLPGLRELILTDLDCSYILQLLERLSTPGVTKLRLELHDRPQDFSELLDYLAAPTASVAAVADSDAEKTEQPEQKGPKFPLLETLIIAALECSKESFTSFLTATPSIRHLELSGLKMSDGLFEQLCSAHASDHAGDEPCQEKETPRNSEVSGYSYSVREQARSITRASSSDTARSHSSTRTVSTAATSPCSVHAPLATHSHDNALLPELRSLKVSGVSGVELCALIRLRQRIQRPLERWFVDERLRTEELERIEEEMAGGREDECLIWFEGEDDDEEDDESEEGDEMVDDEDHLDADEDQHDEDIDDADDVDDGQLGYPEHD